MTDDHAEQMRKIAADQAWLDTLSPAEREAEMQRRGALFKERQQQQNQSTQHSLGSKIKFWLGLLAVAAIVVFGIRFCLRGQTNIEHLNSGDCITWPDDGEVGEWLDTPACSEPHDAQVYHVFNAVGVPSDRYESNCATKTDRVDLSLLNNADGVVVLWDFSVVSESRRGGTPIDQEVVCMIQFLTPQSGSALIVE